jgi:3-oxoacyl-[acyl-carrier-protein] synthase II
MASPAEFPNLVPSSPVGHVSIYLGVRGPALAVSEVGASGEATALQAVDLVAAGEAEAIVAGDVEEAHGIVDRVFAALFPNEPLGPLPERREGGAAIVIEAEDAARARGARVWARLAQSVTWRGAAVLELQAPRDPHRAVVLVARETPEVAALVSRTAWARAPRTAYGPAGGEHEPVGARAIEAAVSRIARGEASEALVIGLAKDRGYAFVWVAP